MALTRVAATNFKSFANVDVALKPFNVVVGPNAAGKSSFIQIFKFIRDIIEYSLDNAISIQGGSAYLTNAGSPSKFCSLSLEADAGFRFAKKKGQSFWGFNATAIKYDLRIDVQEPNVGSEDELFMAFEVLKLKKKGKGSSRLTEDGSVGTGSATMSSKGGMFTPKVNKWNVKGLSPDEFPLIEVLRLYKSINPPSSTDRHPLLLEDPLFCAHLADFFRPIRELCVYDINPKRPRQAVSITGKNQLEDDGSNLALVLNRIIENQKDKERLLRLVKDLVPFVTDLGTERLLDRSIFFTYREKFTGDRPLPASLLSDGTINIVALVVALYFEKCPLVIIEEPERNLHPHLSSRVVDMLRDSSSRKQIIVSTHSPYMLRHVEMDDLIMITRGKDGISNAVRPSEREDLLAFCEEMGFDEAFALNLFEGD